MTYVFFENFGIETNVRPGSSKMYRKSSSYARMSNCSRSFPSSLPLLSHLTYPSFNQASIVATFDAKFAPGFDVQDFHNNTRDRFVAEFDKPLDIILTKRVGVDHGIAEMAL